tara:strand:+ start:500 stop:1483 length:984 start_codon:yes stop_codon:yes gene_type:complete
MSTEITVQSKVEEVIAKSGVAFELDLTQVASLAERGKAITNIDDENFVEVKKEMQQTRKYVTTYFEDARSEFNKMSKGVIDVQKMVLAEFVPEEDRMKELEKAEKERVVREARLEAMPARMERLAAIGEVEILPEEWMGTLEDYVETFEDADFEIMVVQVQSKKNEADKLEIAEAKAKVEADIVAANEALAAKQAAADDIEAARQEERDKASEELRINLEKLAIEKSEGIKRVADEKANAEERRLEAIRKDAADKARIVQEETDRVAAEVKAEKEAKEAHLAAMAARVADEAYQTWASNLPSGPIKFITLENGNVEAYKLVSTYAKN